ncbi:hypothetical protein CTI12_AA174550 [Artemisia annua]|uniref:CCHC-type domain-containing protein n=1 Tax=Artemisia annua TaxID=35608 RepID=A0A2U1PB17_ARTAN|nr:hypothetical protein CTI12_AA174550 [Artemisia annua]
MAKSPWSVMGYYLTLASWNPDQTLDDIEFNRGMFWVQAHGIPFGRMTKAYAIELASKIGSLVELDCVGEGLQLNRPFLRFRVAVDLNAPLCPGFEITRDGLKPLFISFKYERLSNFCYACGRLGHDDQTCTYPKDPIFSKKIIDGMRANSVKRISLPPQGSSHFESSTFPQSSASDVGNILSITLESASTNGQPYSNKLHSTSNAFSEKDQITSTITIHESQTEELTQLPISSFNSNPPYMSSPFSPREVNKEKVPDKPIYFVKSPSESPDTSPVKPTDTTTCLAISNVESALSKLTVKRKQGPSMDSTPPTKRPKPTKHSQSFLLPKSPPLTSNQLVSRRIVNRARKGKKVSVNMASNISDDLIEVPGIGQSLTVSNLRELCRVHRPDIVFLMETKNKEKKLESIRRSTYFDGHFYVNPVGFSGGLALWWRPHTKDARKRLWGAIIRQARSVDKIIWHFDSKGNYTVKSGYRQALIHRHIPSNNLASSSSGPNKSFWKHVWNLKTLPKIKYFRWKVCSNALATQENLSRRGCHCSPMCPICFTDIETVEHMLFECSWTKVVWFGSALGLRLDSMNGPVISRIQDLLDMLPSTSDRMNFHTLLANIAWQIWKSRNEYIFNEIKPCPSHTLSSVSCIVRDLTSLYPSSLPTSCVSVVSESQDSSLRDLELWLYFQETIQDRSMPAKGKSRKENEPGPAKKSIEFAAKQGAALERWNCPYSSDNFTKFAEDFKDKHGSSSFFILSELAYIHSITIVGGSDGEVVGKLEHEEGVLIAEIDLSAINHQRQCIPLQKHRQHDIYKLLPVEEQTP